MSSAVTTTQVTYWMMCPMKSERTMVSLSTPILLSGIDNLCTLNHLTRGLFSQCQYLVFVLLSACYLFLTEALQLKEVKKIQITEKGKLIYTKVRSALFLKKGWNRGACKKNCSNGFQAQRKLQLTSCEGLCCTGLSSAVSVNVPTSAGWQLINCFMGRSWRTSS